MSFSIVLGTNISEMNTVFKQVTDRLTFTGTLKEDTSLIDPVILIETDITETLKMCNYFYITAFNRRYFLTGLRSIRNGLVEISGHVDVLSSFSAQITAQTVLLDKSENDGSLYLNDGTFRAYSNPYVETIVFPNQFTEVTPILVTAGYRSAR